MNKTTIKNLIPLILIIVIFLVSGSFFYLKNIKKPKENTLTPQEAAQKAISYINQNVLSQGMTASLISVLEENGIYKFRLKIADQEYDSFVTKNGKYLFTNAFDLTSKPQTSEEQPTGEIPKKDKPDVKLFVMSYCPYGLQAQKMFLPVYNLLKDKADMGVYFVNYIMHEKKEIDENLRQYCIQKEQKDKYYDYLNCFVKDGNFTKCLSDAKIDQTKLASCVSATDQQFNVTALYNDKNSWLNGTYPKFNVNNDLCEQYGVGGSPTIIINGVEAQISNRSPEQLKQAICQAFTTPPAECSQTLSDTAFSPGFGTTETDSSTSGSCQ